MGSKFKDGSDVSKMEGSLESAVPEKSNISVPAAVESNLQEMQVAETIRKHDSLAMQDSSQTKTSADGNTYNGKDDFDNQSGQDAKDGEASEGGEAENKEVETTSSASHSCSRDVRLHKDLNMDMEEWERPPEEDMRTFSGVQRGRASSTSLVNDMDDADDHKRSPVTENNLIPSDRVEAQPVVEVVHAVRNASSTDAGSVESKQHREPEELISAMKESSVEDYSDALEAEHVDYDSSESRRGDEDASNAKERVESEWREIVEPGSPGQTDGAEEDGSDVEMKGVPVNEPAEESNYEDVRDHVAVEGVKAENADADFEAGGLKNIVIPDADLELRESHDVHKPKLHEELEIQEGLEIQDRIEIQEGIEIQEEIEIQKG